MTSRLSEKPPLNLNGLSSPPVRRRKVNRQSPVPKRRQSSPGRLKRDKRLIRRDSSDSDSNDDSQTIPEEVVAAVENNNRPKTLSLCSHSTMEGVSEKEMFQCGKNRHCTIHNKSLSACTCKIRRNTTVLSPGISQDEVMEKETKLIVLDYLSSLCVEELTARNKTSRTSSLLNTSQEDYIAGKKSGKANTVTIGENERKAILAHLAKQAEEEDLKNGKKLGRSTSDISEKQYVKMRRKLTEMKEPIQKWMDVNLKQEIECFARQGQLKPSPRKSIRPQSWTAQAKQSPLKLTMPHRSSAAAILDTDSLMTPNSFAVNRLEEISEEIMLDYPDLLNRHISELLLPLSNEKYVSYDVFKSIAISVFDLKLARVTPTVWSRIALTLYMVKETMFLGNLNDTQLELLVDYSTKFLKSEASKEVEEEGGWDSLEVEETMLWAGAYDAISTDDENETRKERRISRHKVYKNASFREKVSQTVAEWSPIGIAAMLVAIGIGYSYIKT